MNTKTKAALVDACLDYIRAEELPAPLPANASDYAPWRERVADMPEPDEEAEEAWFELDRMVAAQPDDAWAIICELATRCRTDGEHATLAAGPLTTFLRVHGAAFAARIEEELGRNAGLRNTYRWLNRIDP